MNKKHRTIVILVLMMSLLISSCGPGQLFGPTITPSPTYTLTPTLTPTSTSTLTPTPTPTPTLTPTPIPGIQVPVRVDGIDVQVLSATLGADLPQGYQLKPGYTIVLELEISFTGIESMDDPFLDEIFVVDENKNESPVTVFTFTIKGGKFVFDKTILYFGVKEDAHVFSLYLPDGQMIDLTPILKTN